MRLPCAATEPLKLGFWVPLPCSPRAPLSRPRESSPTGIAAAYESAGIVPLFPLQVPNLALHGIDGAAARSLANYRGYSFICFTLKDAKQLSVCCHFRRRRISLVGTKPRVS